MFVNEKHTGGDNLSRGYLFNISVVHVSRMCLRICLFFITLVLIAILLGMGTLLGPMTQLIAVKATLRPTTASPHTLSIYEQVARRLPRSSMGSIVATATRIAISTATSVGSFSME